MSDLTSGDVQRIVQDGLRDIRDNVQRIRDDVHRVEQRTNDLDMSQTEIREMAQELHRVLPELDRLTKWAEHDRHETQEIAMLHRNSEDIKARVQNIERGVQQLTGYLQTVVKWIENERGPKG